MIQKKRVSALLILFAVIIALIPPLGISVSAATTISSGVVVIDENFVETNGTEYVIENGVFSVTVVGDVNVNIIFSNVTIDRSKDTTNTNVPGIYTAGQTLYNNGSWTARPNNNNNAYYVPTCPFLITGGATVTARFDGRCTFIAGYNGWYATNNNNLQLASGNTHGGYAGIQVDSGSSLTISSAQNLSAYGAYQMALNDENYVEAVENRQTVTDNSGNVITIGDGTFGIEDIIAYNSKPFISSRTGGYNSSYTYGTENGYGAPQYAETGGANSGGAGIGGGAAYNTTSSNQSAYTAGTPGTIIIETGTITAVGGHNAAGIGGGLNGAATSSKIEINGGEVTAVAGRFAAAIGDGDSTSSGTSNEFDVSDGKSYEIIINGGVVKAYGGVSASAIGTTDEITSKGNRRNSALSITIAGGEITALSGESFDGGETTTAAIGAGNGTDMEDNSITIYNEAKLISSSFSNYAISNYGTDTSGTKIPSVNIDPEGYVYLARFNDEVTERVFTVYAIHKNANGHFMYVPTTSLDVDDGNIDDVKYYYALDPGHVSHGGDILSGFYLVDKEGTNAVPDDYEQNKDAYEYDEDTKRYYPKEVPALSAFHDTGTVIETIVVPGKYKAIAITLPKPEEYGGAYVLEVPRANGDPIYTLMEKEHPGVTSGQIQHASGTHILAGENPPPDENRTPNIIIDGTARPFTDLDVGIYKGNAKQETLLPTFVDTVYGYTFYVPSDTEKFWVDFSFDTSYVEGENSVSSKVILVSLNGNDITSDAGSSSPVSLSDLDINEQGKATLWIKKTDTTTAGAKTVSYKITIVVKEKYDFTLNVSALSKIYDGYPVDPKITSMIEGAGFHTTVGGNGLNTSYTESTTPTDPTVDAKTVSVNGTSVSYDLQEISNDNKGKVTYTVSFSYRSYNSNYTGTYSFYVDKDGNVTHGKSITFGSNYNGIQISGNGDTISLQQQTRTATLTITKLVSQEINQISDSDISTTEEKLKKEILDAQEAGNDEFTSASEEVPITGGEGTAIYEVMIGEIRNEYRVEFEFSGTATVTVTYSEGTDHTAKMTQEDKAQIIFTFEKDSSGDGNYEVLLGTGTYETLLSLNELPKDAGKYRVHVFLNSEKYEAEGDATFEIFKKDVHIVAIENWLKYVTPNELSTYDGVITDPGQVYFEGVISGESVSLEAGAEFQYVDTGDPGYLDDVSYGEQKIRITNAALDGHSITNYYLTGVTDGVCYVPGQISYSTSGTMFRKVDDLITSLWRKFYPIEESDYLTWETNDGVFTDNRIDYHSPVPDGANADNGYSGGTVGVHREYVKLRTTGDTSARYSIDIEFGAMQYQFTKRVWNVNTGEYEAVDGESKWNGNNGTNNAVTITNRSNTEIYYEIEFEIDFMYAAVTALADSGIHAALYDTAGQLAAGSMIGDRITSTAGATSILALPSAAPSNTAHFGTAQSKTFELVLSGTPSSITESDNLNYTNVGTITVKIVDPLA